MTSVEQRPPGLAVLSYGFRPFFLGASLQAAAAVLLWMLPSALLPGEVMSPIEWHIHEMLYGFTPAVIAGFLLTAVPSWTARPPVQGVTLGVLFALWAVGRVTFYFADTLGLAPAALFDTSFFALLLALAARDVIAARNWRNLLPLVVMSALVAGNVLYYLGLVNATGTDLGMRIGLSTIIVLITFIGGRVIPTFTRNWLTQQGQGRLPVLLNRFDGTVIATSSIALLAWVIAPDSTETALLLLLSATAHFLRLARWRGERTLSNPLVMILHVGYFFVPVGFLLIAAAIAYPEVVARSAGIHAFTAGGVGIMTLAIMTRASLGHTGRTLHAGPLTRAIYCAIVFAAVARVIASLVPERLGVLLVVSGAAWVLAFSLFFIGYLRMLVRPRP